MASPNLPLLNAEKEMIQYQLYWEDCYFPGRAILATFVFQLS